ncbi:TPA: hypothetical protein ACYR80_000793 [Morganella morganii]|uniref:hypothetical protein n=1 Tax=Morganella morganii TaxID=582 RepID=UPI0010513A83|nr:hypothetical protein [Morganella morganii]ELA9131503.1 hypothetical protein [Morganella morganii]MBA5852824.1 hypothetical protein [Morganella morganii]
MAAENRTKFIVDLVGNVTQRARQFGASIRSFGAEGSRSMRLFSGAVTGANSILDKFDNKLVGFVTGGGLAMATKRVAEHQQAMVELGTQYNLTADQMNALDAQITRVAGNRKLSSSELMQAANAFLLQTNNYDATIAQLDNIALSITGIKMEATAAGTELGGMFNSGYNSPEKIRKWLDGAVTATQFGTGNLNDQLSALRSMGKNTPWKNQEDQMQMLALMRVASQEFDDPSQASAAVQGFFDTAGTADGQKKLKAYGNVNIKGKDGKIKSPADLMTEIIKAGYGKEDNLKQVFSGDTLKLMMVFAAPKKQAQLRDAANPANIRDGFLDEKATQNVQTFNGAMTSLANAGERFAQLKLAKPVQDLADAINDLSPEELDKYAETIEKAAYAIGAAVAARYAWRGGNKILNFVKGAKGGPGAGAAGGDAGLGDGSSVVPVYVTNWRDERRGRDNGGGGSDAGRGMTNGLRAKGLAVAGALPFLSEEEARENIEKRREQLKRDYPNGDKGPSWLPAQINDWWYSRDEKLQEPRKPSPYLTGENNNSFGNWPSAYPGQQLAAAAKPAEPVKPPDGQIRVIVDAAPDLVVKTKSVESENVDLRVNTGYSGGSKM